MQTMTTYELAQKQVTGKSTALCNALVKQKDHVLCLIRDAVSLNQLTDALEAVNLVAPVWRACDYGYKAQEVYNRLADHAWAMKIIMEDNLRLKKRYAGRSADERGVKVLNQFLMDVALARGGR